MGRSEVLIDNEFFLCTKNQDAEGKFEYSLQMHKGITETVEHLVELYDKASYYTEIYEA